MREVRRYPEAMVRCLGNQAGGDMARSGVDPGGWGSEEKEDKK